MTDKQPGVQRIQTGAIGLPFFQWCQRIGRHDERGHPRCRFFSASTEPNPYCPLNIGGYGTPENTTMESDPAASRVIDAWGSPLVDS